ncbi:MAG: CoA-binding protein [Spirosomataceae bacterium]
MSEQPKTLVLGASTNPNRYAYLAAEALHRKSIPFLAVGRGEGSVFGQPIQSVIPSDVPIDTVTVYLSEKNQSEWKKWVEDLHPRRVIFNPGAENPEWARELEAKGIEPIEACTLVMLSTHQY